MFKTDSLKKLISPHQRKAVSLETSVIYVQTLVWALKSKISPDNKTVSFFSRFIIFVLCVCKPSGNWTCRFWITPSLIRWKHLMQLRLRPQPRLSRFFKVMGQNSKLWVRKLSWSQNWCVWSLIRCLENTTRWTPTLPDRISQGWKISTSANYVIIRHHDHESYMARVSKQECPRAWWLLIGWFLFSAVRNSLTQSYSCWIHTCS